MQLPAPGLKTAKMLKLFLSLSAAYLLLALSKLIIHKCSCSRGSNDRMTMPRRSEQTATGNRFHTRRPDVVMIQPHGENEPIDVNYYTPQHNPK